jgi:hypothetical protein
MDSLTIPALTCMHVYISTRYQDQEVGSNRNETWEAKICIREFVNSHAPVKLLWELIFVDGHDCWNEHKQSDAGESCSSHHELSTRFTGPQDWIFNIEWRAMKSYSHIYSSHKIIRCCSTFDPYKILPLAFTNLYMSHGSQNLYNVMYMGPQKIWVLNFTEPRYLLYTAVMTIAISLHYKLHKTFIGIPMKTAVCASIII